MSEVVSDGRHVAFRVAAELWIAEPATGGTRVIPIRPEPGWQQNDLAWSRDGSLLAVAEPAQIRVVRADGSMAAVIGVKGTTPSWLSWTQEKRIVYQTTDQTTDGVSIDAINPDGTHKVQLVAKEPDVWFRSTTVSPDGSRAALVRHENGCSIECRQDSPRVLTMDTDGSNIVEIVIPPDFGGRPAVVSRWQEPAVQLDQRRRRGAPDAGRARRRALERRPEPGVVT